MKRQEFGEPVKRAALERSGGQCEAVGERYGLPAGVRCQNRVAKGSVQFDHFPRPARDPHPDTRKLGNCWATCPGCNQRANNKVDTPREAKMKGTSYDHQLHQARMARKAGLDVPDPPKPRGRQGKKGPPIKSPGFKPGYRPMQGRQFQRRER